MIALIDADVILYQTGFGSDANAKKEGLAFEPLENALHLCKNKLKEVMFNTGADDCKLYLTGKGNYRKDFLPDYKANRKDAHKPHWYNEIKEYLINQHNAIVVDGEEADDALGYNQTKDTIICTIDKDLDCIPGYHFNWSLKNFERGIYYVTEVEANRFFYLQCLTGDATDNIPGLKKSIGKMATKKLKLPLLNMADPLDMYNHVDGIYRDFDWHPIAKCIWIRRKEGEIWEPPTI